MCKDKCAGGLASCNPAGCGNATKGQVATVAMPLDASIKEVAMGGFTLSPFAQGSGSVVAHKSQGSTFGALKPEITPEAYVQVRHDRLESAVDDSIRYEVYVAETPLVWGTEPILSMTSNDKTLVDKFAQELADSGRYGAVILEAYRGDTQNLILGKMVKPKKSAGPASVVTGVDPKRNPSSLTEHMRQRREALGRGERPLGLLINRRP